VRLRPTSIRQRLTLWYAAVLLFLLVCVSVGAYAFVRSSLEHTLRMQMNRDIDTVATVLAAQPPAEGPEGHLPGNIIFRAMEGTRVAYHSSAWCGHQHAQGQGGDPESLTGAWHSIKGDAYQMKVASLSIGNHHYRVTIAENTTALEDTLRALLRVLLIALPCAALLSILGGYFLAGRALSPLSAMADKAQEITAESLSERLPVPNPNDELGRMATVFNSTLARLEGSFERLRTFTANTSHELRTPLTVMRSVGEVALQKPLDVDAARDVIGSLLEEVDRLTRLVECLLAMARAESGSMKTGESIELGHLATSVLELMRVLAEEKRQELSIDFAESLSIRGDEATLRQALTNLLDNAIRYTPEEGHIRVRVLTLLDGSPAIEVEDDGPGIPEAERSRIFERFYRVEDERTKGTGLGLAIARSASEANGGRLELDAAPSGGCLFRIRFIR
jgi:heavy metal sensor kinase